MTSPAQLGADPWSRDAGDAFARALAAERLRRSRYIALLRFVAITIFCGVILAFWLTIPGWIGPMKPMGLYWALAASLLVAARRSDRGALWSSAAISVVDIPMVMLLSLDNIGQLEAIGQGADAQAWRFEAASFFMVVVLLASLALERGQLYLTAGVAIVCQLGLMLTGPTDLTQRVMVTLIIAMTAAIAAYASRRATALVRAVSGEHLRRMRLGRHFAPQVAERIENLGEPLGTGEKREVTLLFCDIRGFTQMSETLASEEVVALLNAFHSRMVQAVFDHGGTLDKLMGDGLMAYFGAPVAQADHAAAAVRCALAMNDAIVDLNAARRAEGAVEIAIGVGVHTGTVVLGNIGSPERRDYTAVGDAVNVAARIERLTRERDATVLVSDATRSAVGEVGLEFSAVEPARVKGKSEPLQCFVPVATARARP